MSINFFKRKKEEPRTFEGRFITDEEIKEMIKPKGESFVKKEIQELNDMVEELRHYGE